MSKQDDKPNFIFEGFESPNTTQVPDTFFDVVAPELTEAELRVALYIIRRTFGFKKDSDNISLRQMVEGITTRDGRVLDRGTGLKKSAVANALIGLQQKGVILSKRNRSAERGNEPTTYALNIKNHPLSTGMDKGESIRKDKPLSTGMDTQYTDLQETVLQQTDEPSNSFEGALLDIKSATTTFRRKDKNKNFFDKDNLDSNGSDYVTIIKSKEQTRPAKNGLHSIAHTVAVAAEKYALRRPKTDLKTADGVGSSPYNHQPQTAPKKRGRPPKFPVPPQVEWMVKEISAEFHDGEQLVASNISHAARHYHQSGLSEEAFCSLLYQAKSRAKQAGNIEKEAGDGTPFRNRMPFFFGCLHELLGITECKRGVIAG